LRKRKIAFTDCSVPFEERRPFGAACVCLSGWSGTFTGFFFLKFFLSASGRRWICCEMWPLVFLCFLFLASLKGTNPSPRTEGDVAIEGTQSLRVVVCWSPSATSPSAATWQVLSLFQLLEHGLSQSHVFTFTPGRPMVCATSRPSLLKRLTFEGRLPPRRLEFITTGNKVP